MTIHIPKTLLNNHFARLDDMQRVLAPYVNNHLKVCRLATPFSFSSQKLETAMQCMRANNIPVIDLCRNQQRLNRMFAHGLPARLEK